MPEHSGYKWSVTADVESLAWDPHNQNLFVVSALALLFETIFPIEDFNIFFGFPFEEVKFIFCLRRLLLLLQNLYLDISFWLGSY